MPIRIVLVDDHALVRQGFRRILEDDPELQVAGEAGNGLDAVALVKKTDPDVVVMDMAMPEMNGLHATMEMVKQRPDTKVLILSMYSDEQYVRNALDAGAKGYILKNAIENDLRRFVERHLQLPHDTLRWKCEQAVRNYDPCISCATHFLELQLERE